MSELKEKLLSAIDNIDFDNLCENQKSTLEKALVMLRVEWEDNGAVNLNANTGGKVVTPIWNWIIWNYYINEPKKLVPFDFSDADKLIGKAVIQKINRSIHQIIAVYNHFVKVDISTYTYQELSNVFTFLDGSLISKEV